MDVEIVDQIAGVHPEEAGQQEPGRTGEVRPRASLELREIRLADPSAQLVTHSARDLSLRELPPQPTSHPLEQTQFRKLLTQSHCNLQYMADCNIWQAVVSGWLLVVSASAGSALLSPRCAENPGAGDCGLASLPMG